MILVPEDEERLKEKELEANTESENNDNNSREANVNVDPPPMYTALAHTSVDPFFSPLPEAVSNTPPPTPSKPSSSETAIIERNVSLGPSTFTNIPNIKPSNFVRVSQANSAVRGAWLIDPAVSIPPSFLPPLDREIGETEETRRNLVLNSRNGTVDGEIYILPTSDAQKERLRAGNRTKIHVNATSTNGSVSVKLHDVVLGKEDRRLPLYLSCSSRNGSITVYLPRSFQGPLNVKVQNGSVRLSDAVRDASTALSTEDGVKRSFLGEFEQASSENGFREGKWLGDELYAESKNGSVRICFDNEADSSSSGRFNPFNLFGKLFSF